MPRWYEVVDLNMATRRRLLAATFAALGAAFAASIATAADIPSVAASGVASIEDYWRLPAFTSPKLSANGRYFAVSAGLKGRLNLVVIDLETRKATALTDFTDFDVLDVHWVGNERLVFTLGQFNSPTGAGQFDGGGFFAVKRDGTESRKLSPTVRELRRSLNFYDRGFSYAGRVPGSDEEVFAVARERANDSEDLYRLNVRTGRKEMLTFNRPGRVSEYILDKKHIARVAISSIKDSNISVVHFRDAEGSPWRELYRFDGILGVGNLPIEFDDDNVNLLVKSNVDRDTFAIYRYDTAKNLRGELIAEHPRFDMDEDSVSINPETRRVTGYAVDGAKPEQVWVDPIQEKRQRTIDNALPNMINSFQETRDGKKLIVSSYSDREPMRWYLLDETKLTLEELFASKPWLGPSKLVEQHPFFYKTRDGMEILGYYFLPRTYQAGQKLPTVVHIHGGPWVRADGWATGFGVREAQLLASRGYAVVLPNFRGTPGLGKRIYASHVGQFGKAMQEDIEDATDWAVAQGFADPARICLSGASYGGYSTLMGLAKTPAKYKCGVAGLAVTDLAMLMTSTAGDIPFHESALQFWKFAAGDPDKDRDALRAVSPAYLAEKIKAPVLLYSGTDDIRVPIEQPAAMRNALESKGMKVIWIAKKDEGHGYGKLENNVDLYRQILEFLGRHIGTGPTP